VDIHDPAEVEWAIATRFQADRDLLVVGHSQGSRLDPSADDGLGAKMGLDATKPLTAPPLKFKRIAVPGQAEIRLQDVLETGDATSWRDRI
jgi:2,5-furandicarboxylate decarboxylase 1